MKLLALDTASGQCSAALLINGALQVREMLTARDHARELLPMVQALLADAGLALSSLDAIAFGRGPGSFTGLRIAASVTQGLAFGADLPVLPVSDLRALAQQAFDAVGAAEAPPRAILACLDARMHEVYAAVYPTPVGELVGDAVERVLSPSTWVNELLAADIHGASVIGAGKGLSAYADVFVPLQLDPARCWPEAEPSARAIARLGAADLAAGRVQPAEAAVPVYLRDQVAQRPVS